MYYHALSQQVSCQILIVKHFVFLLLLLVLKINLFREQFAFILEVAHFVTIQNVIDLLYATPKELY